MGLRNPLHRVRYFCTDAWDEWKHSKAVNMLALLTLVAALFVAALVMLVVTNIERRVLALRDDVKVEIYLQDDHEESARRALVERLRSRENVQRVEYVDKQEALRRYRDWAADLAELVNELDANPLPASVEVFLVPGAGSGDTAAAIAASLEGNPAVEEVRFNVDWLQRLEGLLALARVGGGSLIALVFVAVVFVMGGVLRLAVYARREEIEIMQLVGATPAFIRGPYLVAGAVQGLVASLVALIMLEVVRSTGSASASRSAVALVDLLCGRPLTGSMTGLLVLLGLLVGVAGSYVSVRRSV